jgi:hypothetical protein
MEALPPPEAVTLGQPTTEPSQPVQRDALLHNAHSTIQAQGATHQHNPRAIGAASVLAR